VIIASMTGPFDQSEVMLLLECSGKGSDKYRDRRGE